MLQRCYCCKSHHHTLGLCLSHNRSRQRPRRGFLYARFNLNFASLSFFEIFLLGIPLAILGMIMILFGQRNPLYVVVASIGLVGHLLSLFLGAILFLIMFG